MKEWKIFVTLVAIFLLAYFLPLENPKVKDGILEGFRLVQWYARMHTLACVVPALFIAGAIATFLSHASVIRYLGPRANRWLALGVASVSGCVLAVCSCSVLPMFAGIYQLGAGLGPATAFLYAGPAINVLAIFLSARVLGVDIGLGRAFGAIVFAVILGLMMARIFRKDETKRMETTLQMPEPAAGRRRLWQTALFFVCMVMLLVFADWFNPGDATVTLTDGTAVKANVRYQTGQTVTLQIYDDEWESTGETITYNRSELAEVEPVPSLTLSIYSIRWYLAGVMFIAVAAMTIAWFSREEFKEWMDSTWSFAKMVVPLLFGGVFIVGFISVLIPEQQVAALVGDNSIQSNFLASIVGALFYFATLTEVPITQALMRLGMAKGPALALLLAGPALSLPNMLVIRSVLGNRKTLVFIVLVVAMATITGMMFGLIAT
jgi:uncharacterized membrane protein YraQ (UPF0718 family)